MKPPGSLPYSVAPGAFTAGPSTIAGAAAFPPSALPAAGRLGAAFVPDGNAVPLGLCEADDVTGVSREESVSAPA